MAPFRWISRIATRTPLPWAALGFFVFFRYARSIRTVGWNAIELIISRHLMEHGTYAMSLDYPSALTWRPPLPTLIVGVFRLLTNDPILVYQMFCGLAIATAAACLFWAGRRLGGTPAGHLAAALALTCPAITAGLIDHIHSYSHLGALLLIGPALLAGMRLLGEPEGSCSRRAYALSGVLWGLAFLCRGELVLFAGVEGCALLWIRHSRGLPWPPLACYAAGFLALFAPYNLYAAHVAERDGLLIRKSIYGFYISQGWADPAPGSGGDIEADGYRYAIQLYGDPIRNDESALTAIRRHPAVFLRRIRLNLRAFYRRFWDSDFFPPEWTLAALFAVAVLASGLAPARDRPPIAFLGALFAAGHFVLAYHIDSRYLTVAVPPLILLAVAGCVAAWRLAGRFGIAGRAAVVAAVALGVVTAGRAQWERIRQRPANPPPGVAAMRALGEYFQWVNPRDEIANREPHIGFVFPAHSPLPPEDAFLLPYFSDTAWVNTGADGPFPRGKFYSYRDCPNDYLYLPAEQFPNSRDLEGRTVLGECEAPGLGRYYLLEP